MMIHSFFVTSSSIGVASLLFIFLSIVLTFVQHISSPLGKIPGPLGARISRLWYLKHVVGGNFHRRNIELHRLYGPVVRIAPGQYSIDDPEAVKVIYGIGKSFEKASELSNTDKIIKASWYDASSDPTAAWRDLFTDRSALRHAAYRRQVANLYSATSLRNMEGDVDEIVQVLLDSMSQNSKAKKNIDLQFWMQCFAFDAISRLTLGKSLGLLPDGRDRNGLFKSLHDYLKYCAAVGIFSELHRLCWWILTKLPQSGLVHVANFTAQQISQRSKYHDEKGVEWSDDFLSKATRLNQLDPNRFPHSAVFTTCITNIGAGSDTTSISLSGILNGLMHNPSATSKLRREIDEKLAELNHPPLIPFAETQKMPYLQACIKEGLRVHPATGLPLARVVPEGGTTISGQFFPAGTIVGINTWVAHMNQQVFGPDAEAFRPERWLESSKQSLSAMEGYWMPFGAGSRTCIGKNISLLEINKLIPAFIRRFDLLPQGAESMSHENYWLVKQVDMYCQVAER
ncbi:hypothetical protein PFICI_07601 [Pestalotiopsis fici W106-1]|uniref:Pisatin demethylase n=1 Tax=Pestalotiopsis fici (strain W106-1 / CGMCC3.15140) TaxID=1229662 RepID=W3X3T3_PESFW|nr:uncharacterized protein PFICI_07601 [Pestalotiopsis fici W106-1]ETS80072.1 hypothetical protein PFICI_07601 [Pestalotiopsis fici W106-1]